MKRLLILGLALLVLVVAPAISSAACINTQAGDWDDCGERRRPGREPGSWCGGGGGSSPGGGWRQRQADELEEKLAGIKQSFAALFGGVLSFKPSPEID